MDQDVHYSVGELAEVGGVSRRTVRYYVQEGLLPAPHGLGRGAYYGREHIEQLLRVKAMQERGMTLEDIRLHLASGRPPEPGATLHRLVPRSHWTRVEIVPGVELHVSSRHHVPSPGKLEEIVEYCRRLFGGRGEEENG